MSDQQNCPVCGAPINGDDRFCPNCGAQLGPGLVPLTALELIQPPAGSELWPSSDPLLRLDIEYPDRFSRWKIFVKWIFAIPHFIILSLFGMVVSIIVWVAFFLILVTRRYPESLYKLVMMNM